MNRIYTERAHLMCPNMTFGIVISIDAAPDEYKLRGTVGSLSEAHPFLRALLGQDDDGYYYHITDESQVQIIFESSEVTGIDDPKIVSVYESIIKSEWNLRAEGMLKIISFGNKEKTVILFVFHHLLTDGRGAFILAEEFASCYKSGVVPGYVEEKLISSTNDMPENSSLPLISKEMVKKANAQWEKENHSLSYEAYIKLANQFLEENKVVRTIKVEPDDAYNKMIESCHKHQVSVNDYLVAQMHIEDKTDKIYIAYDLRNQLSCYRKGALGNYFTAFFVAYKKQTDDVWEAACDIRDLVKKEVGTPEKLYLFLQSYAALEGGLLDAAFAASRCGYDSKAARFIGTMYFGLGESKGFFITNLGKFESSNMEEAAFLPPIPPAMRKTLGVITVNGKMVVCSAIR